MQVQITITITLSWNVIPKIIHDTSNTTLAIHALLFYPKLNFWVLHVKNISQDCFLLVFIIILRRILRACIWERLWCQIPNWRIIFINMLVLTFAFLFHSLLDFLVWICFIVAAFMVIILIKLVLVILIFFIMLGYVIAINLNTAFLICVFKSVYSSFSMILLILTMSLRI